jgi:hypothetical protein
MRSSAKVCHDRVKGVTQWVLEWDFPVSGLTCVPCNGESCVSLF